MKKEINVVVIFIILILITNVLAYESTITVKTGLPNHKIYFKPADPETGKLLPGVPQSGFEEESDDAGEVVFNYNLDAIRVKLSFMAWGGSGYVNFLNGKQAIFIPNVILDKFVDVDLNKEEPSIKVYSGEVEEKTEEIIEPEVKNDSEKNEDVAENNKEIIEEESNSGITGKIIGGKSIIKSPITYYVFGGILILVVVIFILRKKIKKPSDFKITKLSKLKENKEKIENKDEELEDAEKKLDEAKEELDEIKNRKSKLQEAREKMEKDKEELSRLEED